MQGFLDYFSTDGQIVTKELRKGQTVFGQALLLDWQPTLATWSVHHTESTESPLRVNGKDIPRKVRVKLNHLDVLALGAAKARFVKVPAVPRFNGEPCDEVVLSTRRLSIGRATEAGGTTKIQPETDRWDLDPEDHEICKIHVEIEQGRKGYSIHDRSTNGNTLLNGFHFRRQVLVPGDRFNFESYYFEFTGTSVKCVDPVSGARVEGRSLVLEVPQKKGWRRILKSVSIEINSGEFLGILGGSGQGKSTLMNVLGGLVVASDGRVTMDGATMGGAGWVPGSVGFVPQEDIVHRELTVREAISLTARLRLAVPREAAEALVSRIIETLGLAPHASQPIHSLSGGQRKRVNIATELLARPPILFLDEPTSGLDPENEEIVVKVLETLYRNGQTIVCTTHSLHKAFLFHRIAFIHDGRLMFLGTPEEARTYFLEAGDASSTDVTSPGIKLERIYKLLKNSADPETWEKRFLSKSLAPFRSDVPPPRRVVNTSRRLQRPGFFASISVLIETQWRILKADAKASTSLLLQAVGIGLLAGWVGRNDPEFRSFACLIATLWFGCSNAAQTITRELAIFRRERIAGLGLHSYILSKAVFLSLISWLQVILLLGAQALPVWAARAWSKPLTPDLDLLPTDATGLLLYGGAFLLAGMVGVMIGLSLSAHARTATQATVWVPLVLIPQILFSGFVVTRPDMPEGARAFSVIVPSASAQRLVDAANVAGKRVPLMTEKTRVPMFFWTQFDASQTPTAHKVWEAGPRRDYQELDEYTTAWQNSVVISDRVGTITLPTHDNQYPAENRPPAAAGEAPEPTPPKPSRPYLYFRPDVRYQTGVVASLGTDVATSLAALLAWLIACYLAIFAGLTLAQPETLQPAWARGLTALLSKRRSATSPP